MYDKEWASSIPHPIRVTEIDGKRTIFTKHIFLCSLFGFEIDKYVEQKYGYHFFAIKNPKDILNQDDSKPHKKMFKMPFNKAKIYDICMMEISMLFVKYGIIRDYEIKFIIFEVIVRYFNFYTEQDDISGKGCIIRNITFNSSVFYNIYNMIMNTNMEIIYSLIKTNIPNVGTLFDIESEDNNYNIRIMETHKKYSKRFSRDEMLMILKEHQNEITDIDSVFEIIKTVRGCAKDYARKLCGKVGIKGSTFDILLEDLGKMKGDTPLDEKSIKIQELEEENYTLRTDLNIVEAERDEYKDAYNKKCDDYKSAVIGTRVGELEEEIEKLNEHYAFMARDYQTLSKDRLMCE